MSFNIDDFVAKHDIKISNDLHEFCQNSMIFKDNHHYFLKLNNTFHYNALITNNFQTYNSYITQTKQKEHSVEIFQKLLDTFDNTKLYPIKVYVELNNKDKKIIIDGVHRLSILKYKGYKTISNKYIDIIFQPCIINFFKTLIQNTINKPLYNGWSNRTEYGYHSFNIYNFKITGQRNPVERLNKIKKYINFENKSVLDLGCNTGGMLFHIPEINKGIGVDIDNNCIEFCKIFSDCLKYTTEYNFIVHDLNTIDINNILNNTKVDIIFLFSIGSWVKNWKSLYDQAFNSTNIILLETNNDNEGIPQLKYFEELNAKITLISENSDDDLTKNFGRKTYMIEH